MIPYTAFPSIPTLSNLRAMELNPRLSRKLSDVSLHPQSFFP